MSKPEADQFDDGLLEGDIFIDEVMPESFGHTATVVTLAIKDQNGKYQRVYMKREIADRLAHGLRSASAQSLQVLNRDGPVPIQTFGSPPFDVAHAELGCSTEGLHGILNLEDVGGNLATLRLSMAIVKVLLDGLPLVEKMMLDIRKKTTNASFDVQMPSS